MPIPTQQIINPPENEKIVLWKYLDFQQLYHLLTYKQLIFSSPLQFDDRLEGAYPLKSMQAMISRIKEGRQEQVETEFHNLLLYFDEKAPLHKNFIGRTFISCWHQADHENIAMWKLYSNLNKGTAITTTYKKLKNLFNDDCYIGAVKYIDDETEVPLNIIHKYFYKRRIYKSEQELRLIYFSPIINTQEQPIEQSVEWFHRIDVDPTSLISEIVMSPFANDLFIESVKKLPLSNIKFRQSELATDNPRKFNNFLDIFLKLLKQHTESNCPDCKGNGFYQNDPNKKIKFCNNCVMSKWNDFYSDLLKNIEMNN